MTRLKFVATVIMGQSPPSELCNREGLGTPFLQGSAEFGEDTPAAEQFCEKPAKRAPSGALLISVRAPVGEMNVADREYGIGRGLCAIVPDRPTDVSYLRFCVEAALPLLRREAGGTTFEAVTADDVRNLELYWPSNRRREAIASFLEGEISRMASLSELKQELARLLLERQTSLMMRALTAGVGKTRSSKRTGIGPLATIPSTWTERRAKRLFTERDERRRPDLPSLTVTIDRGVIPREEAGDRTIWDAADPSMQKVARAGDLVFNKMRLWQGAVGVAPKDGLVSSDYTVAAPRDGVVAAYYATLLKTPAFRVEIMRGSHGIALDRNRMYWDDFGAMLLPVPPTDEQHEIVGHLQGESEKLALIAQSLELLKERRTAIIYSAFEEERSAE